MFFFHLFKKAFWYKISIVKVQNPKIYSKTVKNTKTSIKNSLTLKYAKLCKILKHTLI